MRTPHEALGEAAAWDIDRRLDEEDVRELYAAIRKLLAALDVPGAVARLTPSTWPEPPVDAVLGAVGLEGALKGLPARKAGGLGFCLVSLIAFGRGLVPAECVLPAIYYGFYRPLADAGLIPEGANGSLVAVRYALRVGLERGHAPEARWTTDLRALERWTRARLKMHRRDDLLAMSPEELLAFIHEKVCQKIPAPQSAMDFVALVMRAPRDYRYMGAAIARHVGDQNDLGRRGHLYECCGHQWRGLRKSRCPRCHRTDVEGREEFEDVPLSPTDSREEVENDVVAGVLRPDLDPAPDLDPEATAHRREVQRAVVRLPETLRNVVQLYFYNKEELTQADVAKRLRLPLGTVKTRLREAKKTLRRRLGHSQSGRGAGDDAFD